MFHKGPIQPTNPRNEMTGLHDRTINARHSQISGSFLRRPNQRWRLTVVVTHKTPSRLRVMNTTVAIITQRGRKSPCIGIGYPVSAL
ncbi:Uncharacterized protein HZ326_15993 [Fusarium oxysporum f. sp. albedinis]|nr:Uncharacterized protein HZ326_15993 [Fusarium oxysporum f. sp. albedinis]